MSCNSLHAWLWDQLQFVAVFFLWLCDGRSVLGLGGRPSMGL